MSMMKSKPLTPVWTSCKAKDICPKCKRLMETTIATDFNTAQDHDNTIKEANKASENIILPEDTIREWRRDNNKANKKKRKDKYREMLEKKWSIYQVQKTPKDSDTSSEASFASTNTDIVTLKNPPIRYGIDIAKEVLDNIPVFDGKQGKLNQFLSTIESYSTMYRVCKVDLVMLQSRGKVHKIINHTVAEDPDIKWSDIKRKLTNNYGSTRSGIEASVKITKLSMSSEETVGKYLA